MNYARDKWVAVTVAIVIIALFFGGMFAYQRQQSNTDLLNATAMNDLNSNDNNDNSVVGRTQTRSDGLIIQEERIGNGKSAVSGDTVVVNYVGTLADGTTFDSSYPRNQPFSFTIGAGQVIAGWEEGVNGMKVGGKRKLIIPPALAYGAAGAQGIIPPNATLTFEIELVAIQ